MNTDIVFIALAIVICNYNVSVNAYRKFDVAGTTTIVSLENEKVRIECVTDEPMAYCGFIHPSGKRFSFSGREVIDGHCSIEIKVTRNDSGAWTCHIGKKSVGVEAKQTILLRVVGPISAVQPSASVVHGKQVTLSCVATKTLAPLSYCRFEPPTGAPFSIGPEVKRTNAILGKYFFPENRSLDRGDCAVTIAAAKYDDAGLWTCGAGLLNQEYTDVIRLDVQGLYTMSASVTGVTFGTIGIATFLVILGYMAWKKRHMLGRRRVREEIEMAEAITATSLHGSKHSIRGSRSGTPRGIPSGTPRGSPSGTPRGSLRRESASGSPVMREVPTLVVESPSEPATSGSKHSIRGSPSGTPRGIPSGTPRGIPSGTPRGGPSGTPRGSLSRESASGSPVMREVPTLVVESPSEPATSGSKHSIRGSTSGTPRGIPSGTPRGIPSGTPRGGPSGTPRGSLRESASGSPVMREVPTLVVESPSEPATSPKGISDE